MNPLPIALVLLAGAACKKKVDSESFAARIKHRTEQLGLSAKQVHCPDNVEAKAGTSFECHIELGETSYVLEATITNVDGKRVDMDTRWKDGDAVIADKLGPAVGEQLATQLETPVTVDCGKDALRFLDAQRNVRCDITAGETKAAVILTFDDKLTPTNWKLDPQLLARSKIEQFLTEPVRAKTSPGVNVTCGDQPLMIRNPDGIVWCEIGEGDKKAKLEVKVDDDLNITSWQVAS
jgi:hypothetical protein